MAPERAVRAEPALTEARDLEPVVAVAVVILDPLRKIRPER
jgi:hypothetical protein